MNSQPTNRTQEQLKNLSEYYRNGRLIDAEKLARSITQETPSNEDAWKALWAILKKNGKNKESLIAIQKAAQISPSDAKVCYSLGYTLLDLGKSVQAEETFRKAILLKPDYCEAHFNLGVTLKRMGRLEEAEASYKQAIAFKPDYAQAHNNLGKILQKLGRLEEAEASYKQAIALKPNFGIAKHNLAALTGETTKTAPRDYVEHLFDSYAAKFEIELIDNLDYKIPRALAELIIRDSKFYSLGSITDLGCGTGLFGLEIIKFCERLEGVDLSEKMLEKAKEKNVYTRLVKQDISEYLSTANLNFDYFVLTDVFIYIGDLFDVFRLIKSRNYKGGKLVFSTEHRDGDKFFLEPSGRYSHSKNYIDNLCKKFGYEVSHFEIQNLRKEKNQYIKGGLYILNF